MFKIIIGNLSNLPGIVNLNFQVFKKLYSKKPYSLSEYQQRLKNKKPIILIIKNKKQIIANSISFKQDNSYYLWIIAVDKKFRGQKLGDKLITKNEQIAKKLKFASVTTKVYNISEAMKYLLAKNSYDIIQVNTSIFGIKEYAIYYKKQI